MQAYIKTDLFDYHLPEERIAQYPLDARNQSKLLIYRNGQIRHTFFYNIINEIPSDYLLVFNNTKVVPARLFFQKETGANIEILLLEPHNPKNYEQSFNATNTCEWFCMIGNARKWKHNNDLNLHLSYEGKTYTLTAQKLSENSGIYIVKFTWDLPLNFKEVLHHVGKIPIPPYLKRNTESIDTERYQTIFSKIYGSVAAPTASLHFTEQEFESFKIHNIHTDFLTLHVGIGTFKPMTTTYIHEHELHAETFSFSTKLLDNIIRHYPKIIAVGTTSLRALESILQVALYYLTKNELVNYIPQFCEHERLGKQSTLFALTSLYEYLIKNKIDTLELKTQLMISPLYETEMVEGLITNFHQPRSSLLALVAGFVGSDWREIYDYALQNNFRFLSYGDSSLLWKQKRG